MVLQLPLSYTLLFYGRVAHLLSQKCLCYYDYNAYVSNILCVLP
jgi:hypothetical protein